MLYSTIVGGRLGRARPSVGEPAQAADPGRQRHPGGRVGHANATVEQLLAFARDFIELTCCPDQGQGRRRAGVRCHYGTSNGKYAIRIDRLLTGSQAGWLGEQSVPSTSPKKTAWRTNGRLHWPNSSRPRPNWRPVVEGRRWRRRRSPTSRTVGIGAPSGGNDPNLILDIPVQLTVSWAAHASHQAHPAAGPGLGDRARRWPASRWTCWSTVIPAQGEVVVNDKFGIRLTDIVTPSERMRYAGAGPGRRRAPSTGVPQIQCARHDEQHRPARLLTFIAILALIPGGAAWLLKRSLAGATGTRAWPACGSSGPAPRPSNQRPLTVEVGQVPTVAGWCWASRRSSARCTPCRPRPKHLCRQTRRAPGMPALPSCCNAGRGEP